MTTSTRDEAKNIIQILLEEKLIVCANIIENISSFFWWKGNIEEEKEVLVFMKSIRDNFEKISKRVKELHSYDIPEILSIPIVDGSSSYLDWMKSVLNQ
ncbi:MAG: divalent-cation tolerance protein CutA [Candidatus Bathyarchaeota archaeon]